MQQGPQKYGKNCNLCSDLNIDTWDSVMKDFKSNSIWDLEDVIGPQHTLDTVFSTKYLGDIFQADGRQEMNIKERINRGYRSVKEIAAMLDEMCLGQFYFQSGNILRNSLLLSSLLTNSEAWYNVTSRQMEDLERVDEEMLRKILEAPSKTPKELLYLETGNIPLRYVIMGRRLNYLWYLLNEEDDSLIRQFLEAQISSPLKGDWYTTVRENMNHLELDISLEAIAATSKSTFKLMVKEAIMKKSLTYLQSLQNNHSKSKNIKYTNITLQPYLQPSDAKLSIQEKKFIFAARSRMLDVLCNFKTGKKSLLCRACDKAQEDQIHLMQCEKLSSSEITNDLPQYDDIFCDNTPKVAKIGRILRTKFNSLKKIINQPDAPSTVSIISNVNNVFVSAAAALLPSAVNCSIGI